MNIKTLHKKIICYMLSIVLCLTLFSVLLQSGNFVSAASTPKNMIKIDTTAIAGKGIGYDIGAAKYTNGTTYVFSFDYYCSAKTVSAGNTPSIGLHYQDANGSWKTIGGAQLAYMNENSSGTLQIEYTANSYNTTSGIRWGFTQGTGLCEAYITNISLKVKGTETNLFHGTNASLENATFKNWIATVNNEVLGDGTYYSGYTIMEYDSAVFEQGNNSSSGSYMVKMDPSVADGQGMGFNIVNHKAGITYVFSFDYNCSAKTKDGTTPSIGIFCPDQGNGWITYAKYRPAFMTENSSGTLSLEYTPTQIDDDWDCVRWGFAQGSGGCTAYISNMTLKVKGTDENLFEGTNALLASGSFMNWFAVKANGDITQDLTEYNGFSVVAYDASLFENTSSDAEYGNENYRNNGNKITILKNCSLDFSTVYHRDLDNKLFIGWQTANGETANNDTALEKDTVLNAKYISLQKSDFNISQIEVRTDGELGLRFVVNQTKKLVNSLPEVTEYGTVVLPSEILNKNSWADIIYNRTYKYAGTDFDTAAVKGVKTFTETDTMKQYTLCITGIDSSKYQRQYTVKAYIKYVDINGLSQIVYSEYASANLFETSKKDVTRADVSEENKELLNSIIDNVKEKHNKMLQETQKINVVGTSANPNTWIYQLGKGGVMVREVNLDTGKGGESVEIVHLTDPHYNYMNERDFAENNPTLMSTYKNRGWGANGEFVELSRSSLAFGATADSMIITGDVLDYLSWGCIELMQKEIWDKYPNAIITLGNHEPVQQMQGTVGESLLASQRFSWLQSVWKHDIYYVSQVLKNKVMTISMDNGWGSFSQTQYDKLASDIALAKKNGYIILLFTHIPFTTSNPKETAVAPLLRGDLGTFDFCNNSDYSLCGSERHTALTNKTIDLIKNNADIIKGVFNGHMHSDYYTEIVAKTSTGEDAIIPQYTGIATMYNGGVGHIIKITVK